MAGAYEIGTFNPTDIAQQTYADYLAREKVRQLLEQQQEMHPLDMKYKEAMTRYQNALADNYGKPKDDPLKNARARREGMEQSLPMLEAMGPNDPGVVDILKEADPTGKLAEAYMRSPDKNTFIKSFSDSLSRQNKVLAGREVGLDANNAKRNIGEMNVYIAQLKADALRDIAAFKARNPQTKNMSTDQLYAATLQAQGVPPEEILDRITLLKSAGVLAKPNDGITAQVTPGKGIEITNKSKPKVPTLKAEPGSKENPIKLD